MRLFWFLSAVAQEGLERCTTHQEAPRGAPRGPDRQMDSTRWHVKGIIHDSRSVAFMYVVIFAVNGTAWIHIGICHQHQHQHQQRVKESKSDESVVGRSRGAGALLPDNWNSLLGRWAPEPTSAVSYLVGRASQGHGATANWGQALLDLQVSTFYLSIYPLFFSPRSNLQHPSPSLSPRSFPGMQESQCLLTDSCSSFFTTTIR